VEIVCEAWMRQWAVPNANSKWGGPPGAALTREQLYSKVREVQGPLVEAEQLRPEALLSAATLLRSAKELHETGGHVAARVSLEHRSHSKLAGDLCWGAFETEEQLVTRLMATLEKRTADQPNQTLVFVSHGHPTYCAFNRLVGSPPERAGGMTALSILSRDEGTVGGSWQVLLENEVLI